MGNIKIGCTRILSKDLTCNYPFSFIDKDFVVIKILEAADVSLENMLSTSPIFTSVNGVKGFLKLLDLHGIKSYENSCYCIKGKTSQLALSSGLKVAQTANSSEELAYKIIDDEVKNLIHYTSIIRREDLAKILTYSNINLQQVIVYEKTMQKHVLKNIDAILFFSPSQIDAFYNVNDYDVKQPAFCIGAITAKHLEYKGHQNIIISKEASEIGLLETAVNYFNI